MTRRLFALAILILPVHCQAELADTTTDVAVGERIAARAAAHIPGFGSLASAGRVVLSNGVGQSVQREFTSQLIATPDGGFWLRIEATAPNNLKGTIFVSHNPPDGPAEAWTYLPSMRKTVHAVGTAAGRRSFFGSEFTYEDIHPPRPAEYRYRWVGDEACPTVQSLICHKLERRPQSAESGYARIVDWIDVSTLRTSTSHYYDRKDELLKIMSVENGRHQDDRYWSPLAMTMRNVVTGRTTRIDWIAHDFGGDISIERLRALPDDAGE